MESGDIDPSIRTSQNREALTAPTPKEKELSSLEKTSEKQLGGGINQTVIIDLKDDGSGVFKPVTGEHSFGPYKEGTLYKRERAAYVANRIMGWNLVPPTVIREIDNQPGSFQAFVPDAYTLAEAFPQGIEDQLYKVWIFDRIIWNSDRHEENALFAGGNFYGIDHGYSFADRIYKEVIEEFYNQPAPERVIQIMANFMNDPMPQRVLREQLSPLLPKAEVDACLARAEFIGKALMKNGIIEQEVPFYPATSVWQKLSYTNYKMMARRK